MKKISLFLLALICSVATWAAIITTTPVAGTEYYIKCIATDHTGNLADDGTTLQGRAATGTKFVLVSTGTEGQYYIKSVTTNKYINASGTTSGSAITFDETATTYWTIDQTNANTDKYSWAIRPNGTAGVSLNNNGSSTADCPYMKVNTHTSSTQGCDLWTFDDGTVSYPYAISTVDGMVNGHIYTFRSSRNGITWDGSSTTCTGGTIDVTTDNNDKFVAIKKGATAGVFYLYNMGAGKFMSRGSDNSAKLTDATPLSSWTIKTGGTSTSYPMMMDSQDGNHFNFGGSRQITVDTWSTADAGNSLEIMDYGEADEDLLATIKATYTPKVSTSETTYYYAIKSLRSSNYAKWTGDDSQLGQSSTLSKETYWYFTEDGKLHNAATTNLYAGTSSFTAEGATTYIKENPYNPTYFCVSTTEALTSNCWDSQDNGTKIGTWAPASTDYEGTSWTFEPVEYTPSTGTVTVKLTDAAGNTFEATVDGNAGEEPELTGAYGYTLSDKSWSADNQTLTATITFPFATSNAAEGGTKVATTIQSELGTSKWYAKDGNVIADNSDNTTVYESTADNYRWYIFPTLTTDGQFKFKLYNVGAQKYIPNSSAVSTSTNTATALADAGGDYSYWHINTGEGFGLTDGSNKFLTVNTSGTNQNIWLWTYSSGNGHKGSNLSFPELTVVTKAELKSQVEALANTTKFELVEGATVISPTEYAAPSEINAAIDAAKAVDTDDENAMVTFLTSTNASTIKTFQSASKSYGDPLTCNYTATEGWNTIIMPVNFTVPSTWTLYTCAAVEGKVLTLATVAAGQNKNTPFIVKSTAAGTFQIIGYAGGAATENVTSGLLTGVITSATPSEGYVLTEDAKAMAKVYEATSVDQYHCYLASNSDLTECRYYFDSNDVPSETSAEQGEITWNDKAEKTGENKGKVVVTLGSGKYSTVCLPYNATVENGVVLTVAGYVKNDSKVSQLVFSYVGDTEATSNTIEGGKAYLVRAIDASQDIKYVKNEGATATSAVTGDAMVGTYSQITAPEAADESDLTYYFLSNKNADKQTFAKVGTDITIPAFKAYVDLSKTDEYSASARKTVVFNFAGNGEATGIIDLNSAVETLNNGKFINNGRVVIVKNGKKFNVAGQAVK